MSKDNLKPRFCFLFFVLAQRHPSTYCPCFPVGIDTFISLMVHNSQNIFIFGFFFKVCSDTFPVCFMHMLIISIVKQCKPTTEPTQTSVAIWIYRFLFIYTKVTNWWDEIKKTSLNVTHVRFIRWESFRHTVKRKNLLKWISVYFKIWLLKTESWKCPFLTLWHRGLLSFNYHLVPSLCPSLVLWFWLFFFPLLSLTELLSPSWSCF